MGALDRLLAKVETIEPDTNGCRLWPFACDAYGYAVTTLREHGRRLPGTARVGRRVLEAKIGRPMNADELACHTCDTPQCVAANHLWVGSAFDNQQDAIRKGRIDPVANGHRMRSVVAATGRQVRGDDHGRRKLNSDQVNDIRRRLGAGVRNRDLAAEYGVCPATISLIRSRTNWAHLP